ncbi:XdhC family protein [Rhizobium sp. S152]|uniref:XdhC family protein n=1 Tax=Rhizobium sp. S152 TaxID=3055038 RepID=UPI0025A9ED03|nr:XdhC family protein [Rhizobium sp. S152]MDM9628542.1 XdhC family protein [Rhizobium sp. S152]
MHTIIENNIDAPMRVVTTDDATDIIRFAINCVNGGQGAALATLVEVRGGAARSLGAQMAIRGDGGYCGYISGGCVEAAIAAEARDAIIRSCDRFLMLGSGSEFFDVQLPCGGGLTVAIHVLRSSFSLDAVVAHLANRRPVALRYEPKLQKLELSPSLGVTGWVQDAFLVDYRPRVRVVVSGGALEVESLSKVANSVNYDVLVHDYRGGGGPTDGCFDSDTAVASLYHDLDLEMPFLRAALASEAFYVGALGSSRTHDRRVLRLREHGVPEADINRIRAPIGLFPHARNARFLAISCLADMATTQVRV